MKYKFLLPIGLQSMDKVPDYFRRVANQTDATGFGDVLGQGGRALSPGTSLFLTTAQCSGPGIHEVGRPNPFESRPAHEVQVFVAQWRSAHG